jgi:hypothetical protein
MLRMLTQEVDSDAHSCLRFLLLGGRSWAWGVASGTQNTVSEIVSVVMRDWRMYCASACMAA